MGSHTVYAVRIQGVKNWPGHFFVNTKFTWKVLDFLFIFRTFRKTICFLNLNNYLKKFKSKFLAFFGQISGDFWPLDPDLNPHYCG